MHAFVAIKILLGSAQTLRDRTHASGATPQRKSEDLNRKISKEGGFSFERLKATKGAIFDHLYSKLITPKLVFEAFNVAYAGCPPTITMDSKVSGYAGTYNWRRKV